MPPTERLYYQDSHLIEFEALVTDKTERVSGWTAVRLDRTAFYPTGGGQPSDTGTLNGERVLECIEDDENGVLHVIQGRAPEVGASIQGRVDWPRRLDHIQQHTGQHILSQAFVTLFSAPTRGFRVLHDVCEIDVELTNPTNELIERAVELANNVIWENREITIKQATAEEAAQLPLRKDPSRAGELRLIEIESFDLTPCGGTHAYRTGEVGMIALRSWVRAKGLVRVEFVAGMRALADYRRANRSARDAAALFSCGRDDVAQHASQLVEESKELRRQVRALEEIEAGVEAERLFASVSVSSDAAEGAADAAVGGAPRVIKHVFEGRDTEFLKRVAHSLIARSPLVALLGSRENNTAKLVFARSPDAPSDMNALMREACAVIDGRGGGKPDMAQGGGQNIAKLKEALERVAAMVSGS